MVPETPKSDPIASALAPPLPTRDLPLLPERFQPRNLTELMSWAKLVIGSGLAPKGMNEAGVVLCVQMGAELGVTPTQALQNIAVINGRPSIYGDLGKAIFMRDAAYQDFEEAAPDKAASDKCGWCRITMKNGAVVERRFTCDDAKAAGLLDKSGPWQQYRGRMLMFRARWLAMRDAAPGVFKGVHGREEIEDIVDAEVVGGDAIRRPRRVGEAAGVQPEQVDKFVREVGRGSFPQGRSDAGTSDAPAAPAGNGDRETFTGMVQGVDRQSGKTKGKDWTKYTIVCAEAGGKEWRFGTFDPKHAGVAEELCQKAALAKIEYTTSQQYGNELKAIDAAGA